jgi:hypothetical protein
MDRRLTFSGVGTTESVSRRRKTVAKKPHAEDLAGKAKFIFDGTVRKMNATTMKEVPSSDRTVVIHVDKIIAAPEALADFASQDVTVELAEGEDKVAVGQAYIFYTNGWIFGDGLAVRSIGHSPATRARAAALEVHPDDPVRNLRTHEASTQASKAALIVSGRVSAVRLPKVEAAARAAVAAGRRETTEEPISEHTPIWNEAVIDIDKVHRGKHGAKQVVVRFPSSTDVRWYHAPKFHTGQEGVFLLHKGQLAPEAKAVRAAAVGPGQYTALDPADVQPLDELPRILAGAGIDEP